MGSTRLVHDRWRPLAQSAITAGLGVAVVLGVLTFHDGWTWVDTWVFGRLQHHLGPLTSSELIGFTDPPVSITVVVLVALAAGFVRRFDVLLFAALSPVLAVVLTSWVLKPLLDRPGPLLIDGQLRTNDIGSYPSGHQTGVTSVALMVFVVVCGLPLRRRGRALTGAVLGLWCLITCVGLTRAVFHYFTDTVGAVGVSTAVVLGTALLVDRWVPDRLRGRPAGRPVEDRPRAAQLT